MLQSTDSPITWPLYNSHYLLYRKVKSTGVDDQSLPPLIQRPRDYPTRQRPNTTMEGTLENKTIHSFVYTARSS